MARLDSWTDPEIAAATNALAAFSDWAQGAVGANRAAQQPQLDAEITRLVNQVPGQGTAIIGQRIPFHIAGLADGKLQQEAWWRVPGHAP
jgi:hypothetical protein